MRIGASALLALAGGVLELPEGGLEIILDEAGLVEVAQQVVGPGTHRIADVAFLDVGQPHRVERALQVAEQVEGMLLQDDAVVAAALGAFNDGGSSSTVYSRSN